MSAEAAIADACDTVVAPSAAATALMVVDGGSGEAAQLLADAALRANMLIIEVELLASDKAPWVGAGAPGAADGCALGPGDCAKPRSGSHRSGCGFPRQQHRSHSALERYQHDRARRR